MPDMALERIGVPVLVAHHKQDSCRACLYSDLPRLTSKLVNLPKTLLMTFDGGDNTGDPCEPRAYHGYNGIEAEVVGIGSLRKVSGAAKNPHYRRRAPLDSARQHKATHFPIPVAKATTTVRVG